LETFDTNVIGTVNLLNELRKADSVKAIVVVTSDKSYRNNEWVYPYGEKDELGGRNPYSASKSCQDIVAQSFKESYFSDPGVALSSVRARNVIGSGDWAKNRLVPDIVRGIVDGHPIIIHIYGDRSEIVTSAGGLRPENTIPGPIADMTKTEGILR